jgi:hypothetical protein
MTPSHFGKYQVTGKLGKGAMGEVFRAHDPVLGRDVAIKVLSSSASDERTAGLLREAQAAAHLNHPNIVTVHDFGREQDLAYMAMELLDGSDLRERIEKKETGEIEERLYVMSKVLDGMAFAHERGIIHRDLKPGNVRVLGDGQVKVLDFGLARRNAEARESGTIRGTPYYMAPEQVRSEAASERSDVFSLGAMFYELLTGRKPFPGASVPAVLYAVVHDEPLPLGPECPDGIAAVILKALRKDPLERFANAGEMRDALNDAWLQPGEEERAATALGLLPPDLDLGPPLASRPGFTDELRNALYEVDEYLDDRVPPLMVADSVVTVAGMPPADAALHVLGWAHRQMSRVDEETTVAEVLFFALHKLAMVGELNLADKPRLIADLRAAGGFLVEACAPADRDSFRDALARLGESSVAEMGLVQRIRAAATPRIAPATTAQRRLSLLEQRLRRDRQARGAAAEAARRRVTAQALSAAANEAHSAPQLVENLKRLRAVGVPSGAGQVFRSLGQELPDWALPKEALAEAEKGPLPSEVRAMRQIVALAEDPAEVASRYKHLVSAATDLFNQGNLGRSVRMLQLAASLTAEKKVEPGYAEPVLRRGHEGLDREVLRSYMENPDRHPQLQAVMSFFEAGLGVETLMDQLETEERRDRRRMALDLLVVHGEKARASARARLLASLETPTSDFARRNWIYLMRLVPRTSGEAVEPEIDALARFALPGSPGYVVREALLCLGQTKHPRSAQALAAILEAWEGEAERARESSPARVEAHATLDRIASALARQGDRGSWTALVEHGLSRRPDLGDTTARLSELGGQDLSPAADVVEALCADIREGLPRGVLGRLVGRGAVDLPALVSALAGTRTAEVKSTLQQVVKKCAGQEAERVAARVLESLASPPPAAVSGFSGELDRYGLGAVLHRLARGKAGGTLLLVSADGGGPASVGVAKGYVVSARHGHRRGLDAFYQLFERPFAGTYALEPSGSAPSGAALGEVPALVAEGIRRSAELGRAIAIVPDDAALEPTGQAPGTIDGEPDYELVVALWQKACSGVLVAAMEAEMAPDALRLYSPLAQWLEEGALRIAGPETPPDPPSEDPDDVEITPGS